MTKTPNKYNKSIDATLVNAMSVDVEDYFQVSAFEGIVNRDDWGDISLRVETNIDRILDIFETRDVRATFFTLGWIAERAPQMVRRIVDAGHEIASHGMEHHRVTTFDATAFQADVSRSKAILEDIAGKAVLGYRAPSYSIGRDNLWALDVLADVGFIYSSSIYPIAHDHYGMPEAPRFAFNPRQHGVLEIPVSTFRWSGRSFPCGGGGYFRFFPYALSRWAIQRVNRQDRQSTVFYFHPWEIDPDQPRISGISAKTRFRHYINLNRTESRLHRLLSDFHWDRMDRVFASEIKNPHMEVPADAGA
ncbi:XrtA system polysaccharide deacetylase [Acidihalobacter aeolianus]|uniref:XrtA system polysaccharide deacetylase n=1 Tax=Acidihalobacter aeolianus TaxID=2792603 RepID=UPI0009F32389|nr:XrtA system polysaccharide deacetylase [Acidihalobacter aeolianus]